jgi:hypothetical protein
MKVEDLQVLVKDMKSLTDQLNDYPTDKTPPKHLLDALEDLLDALEDVRHYAYALAHASEIFIEDN